MKEEIKMNIIGKKVTHVTDGTGVITAFYPNHNNFNVQFPNGVTRHYDFPYDFYPGKVLSNSPSELIDLVNSLPRNAFHHKNTSTQFTQNKSLNQFYQNSISILSDLHIPFDPSVVTLSINKRLKTTPGRVIPLDYSNYNIELNPKLLNNSTPDSYVYQTLLHLMLKTTSSYDRRYYNELLHRETGYTLSPGDVRGQISRTENLLSGASVIFAG